MAWSSIRIRTRTYSKQRVEKGKKPRADGRWHAIAVPVAPRLGTHQPDRRLRLAQQRQDRCG